MKVQKTVKRETLIIAAGTVVLTVIMVIVFLLLGYFECAVLTGAVLGAAAAILDFFLLGITVQKAAEIQAAHPIAQKETDEPQDEGNKRVFADPETAKLIKREIQLSYYGRRAMLVLIAATGLTPYVNMIAVVVPMLFPKMIIHARNIAQRLPKGV